MEVPSKAWWSPLVVLKIIAPVANCDVLICAALKWGDIVKSREPRLISRTLTSRLNVSVSTPSPDARGNRVSSNRLKTGDRLAVPQSS